MTDPDEILIAQFIVKGTPSLLIASEAISRVMQDPPNQTAASLELHGESVTVALQTGEPLSGAAGLAPYPAHTRRYRPLADSTGHAPLPLSIVAAFFIPILCIVRNICL